MAAASALLLTVLAKEASSQSSPGPPSPAASAETQGAVPQVAVPQVAVPELSEARRTAARRHFENGVKLYGDRNYVGALAEFDAAYELVPGHGTLQNVALCKKALYRYAAAADDLERLLERHARELTGEAQQTIRQAITELNALVGRVVIMVVPRNAAVNVDGQMIGAERARGLRLDVGEHAITVSAPGYASASRSLRVTAGPEPVIEQFVLEPNTALLSIRAEDPQAVIEVDGKRVGRGRWEGVVQPGLRKVRILSSGHKPFEQTVGAEPGRTTQVVAPLGPRVSADQVATPPNPPLAAVAADMTGWYALGTLAILAVVDQPRGLEHRSFLGETQPGGLGYGARAGYRLTMPLAVELMVSGSRQRVAGACDRGVEETALSCEGSQPLERSYTLSTARFGANLRILTKGETYRLSAALGPGLVRHKLRVDAPASLPEGALAGYQAYGWDPYLLLELGVERMLGHFSVGIDLHATIDATGNLQDRDYRPYQSLLTVGVGTRIGWAEWGGRGSTP